MLNKRVFILEDDPVRIRYFKETFIGVELTLISSCTDADQFQPPYDAIFLDHDLGGRQMEEHEDCGTTFVGMVKSRIEPADVIVIHSYNGPGAERMLNELATVPAGSTAVYAPYRGPTFNRIVEYLFSMWATLQAMQKVKKT